MAEDLFRIWSDQASALKAENRNFLRSLPTVNKHELYAIQKKLHTETFKKIDCLSCANCCRTTPALITNSDVNRISKQLNISSKQFLRQYVIKDLNGDMILNSVPCNFLNKDNSCQIYDVRPEACKRYPHTDEAEFASRAGLNLANTIVCPAAFHIVQQLKNHFATP